MILCLETSSTICSVALANQGKLVSMKESVSPNDHASKILKHIDACLDHAGIQLKDIEAIAISQGPGSFTGLRVGVSAAKGLCYALDIPLIAVSTLGGLAFTSLQKYPEARYSVAMIEARRDEVYGAIYKSDLQLELKEQVITLYPNWHHDILGQEERVIFCGPGSKKYRDMNVLDELIVDANPPTALNMICLAFEKHIKKDYSVAKSFSPNYLKLPHITQPRKVL